MEVKDDNSSFIYGYLALQNTESKSIDIYKIYPKNNFKLIQSIKVNCKNIDFIKFFYDPYLKVYYLAALINKINDENNILIWKILNESQYILIYSYSDDMLKGAIIMSEKQLFLNFLVFYLQKVNFF